MDEPSNAASVRALGAWGRGKFGRGVKLAIVDDGFDLAHKDISPGCDRSLSANYCSGDKTDPSPRDNEAHGTSASAVAAAHGSNLPPGTAECGHGVAPLANIVGVRLIAEPVSDADEARGLTHGLSSGISIYSCSWGPSDDGQTLDGPGDVARAAIEQSGAVYVWAAGNGRDNADSCAYDGYASNPNTIAVAAATYLGNQAWYSESCPAVFVAAPSSGDGRGVTTADVSGRKGYSAGNCNSNFGGTSAAAPVVAGIVALILETEPALKRHDVARILAATARRIDESDPSWQLNAANVRHSDAYGFGVADADAAVALAETWLDNFPDRISPPTEKFVFSGASGTFPIAIPDRDSSRRKISSAIFVEEQNCVAEGVVASVTIKHARRGDLRIKLYSPGGSISNFEPRPDDHSSTGYSDWPFYSVAHWNESCAGTWILEVEDTVAGNRGELSSWRLEIYGCMILAA